MPGHAIGEAVEGTGVPEATLRMWKRRHGFPTPERLPSGHRRYSDEDLELVARVAAAREAGVSLAVAIAHARAVAPAPQSVFANLRRLRPIPTGSSRRSGASTRPWSARRRGSAP